MEHGQLDTIGDYGIIEVIVEDICGRWKSLLSSQTTVEADFS